MSTMEQHLKNIKISLGQMIEVDQPEVGLLRSQRESFKNIIKLATLQDTVQGEEDAVFASGLCMLENKIDRVEIISQNQQQTLYSNRMDWNNVRYFFGDLAYSISVLESVYKLAKFLENLCLKQDQINSHDLKERAEKFKLEAKFKFREEHPLLRGKFDLNDSFFDASQNWFKDLVPTQQQSAIISSKLKEMRFRYTKIVEDLCTKQRLELLQKGRADSSVESIERSSHYIFSKFLRAAAYTTRVLEDLVRTAKYLENQDYISSDEQLKAKAGDLMLKTLSILELEDQLLSEIRDEHVKIASLGAESRNWSKVLGLVQQRSVIIDFKLENIRKGYTKIVGNL